VINSEEVSVGESRWLKGEAVSNLASNFQAGGRHTEIIHGTSTKSGRPCRSGIPAHFAPHAAASLAPPRMFTARFMLYAKNDSEAELRVL